MLPRHIWLLFPLTSLFLIFLFISNSNDGSLDRAYRSIRTPIGSKQRIVIYNRIPKTGSTTFTNAIAYDLYKINDFNVIHVNITRNRNTMSLPDQQRFISNITNWKDRQPAFYHGHLAHIDFRRFGYPNPIYINLVREPVDRFLSYYYFLRYGDNFRVGLKRSRAGNNETFDECVEKSGKDCDFNQMWMQIPYFCGHYHYCSEPGNKQALEKAKQNLEEQYLLVGLTERLRDSIAMLEVLVPDFFDGALAHYDSLDDKRAHLRSTKKKIEPHAHTLSIIYRHPVYKMEAELYQYAKNLFDLAFRKATNGTNDASNIKMLNVQFHYEKIKPV